MQKLQFGVFTDLLLSVSWSFFSLNSLSDIASINELTLDLKLSV